jgi:chorismate lyase/3-hydroxybenzoate synthase
MPDHACSAQPRAGLQVKYLPCDQPASLAPGVLAAVTFGAAIDGSDPRLVRVGLEPMHSGSVMEVWYSQQAVRTGTAGLIRYSTDEEFLFGVIEIDEREYSGVEGAAEASYGALRSFLREGSHPHLLRVWNYFDGINRGVGDQERYKQFCVGRAAGLGPWPAEAYPAATVIGRRDGSPMLQVYWLAARSPGTPVDNPRQVRPHRYPRQYGPRAPQFSRAMLLNSRLVLISGTASIVGHASHHAGDLCSQLSEVLANLESVLHKAAGLAPALPGRLGAGSLLKFYLRDHRMLGELEGQLRERLPAETPRIILTGDVCRADLLLEADGLHRA